MDIKSIEEEVLKYWDDQKVFEQSVKDRPENHQYTFYDGPPFATGLPHYGHILASTIKDVVPRYWTMKGYRVERKWGWDCHGLPIENIVEKELNLKDKQAIEDLGIANFNNACRNTVLRYAQDWKKVIHRLGRWVDMENDYKTMEPWYMESLWWVFKSLFDRGLIYQGHKSMHVCPRCVTPLSNFEVSQGYKEVKDISVIAEFKLKDSHDRILAWTTTPWTLPGNVMLALNPKATYVRVKANRDDVRYIVAKDRLEFVFGSDSYTVEAELSAQDLANLAYEPLFPYFKDTPRAFRTVLADFVTLEEGTGIVHIAPAFGEDDYKIGLKESIPLVQHVTMEGKFIHAVTDFADLPVKPKDNPVSADIQILKYLEANDSLFKKINITHTYPHCWRCDSPLINYATNSWFVDVTKIKEGLLANNQKTNWVPAHIKNGRFGKWLENARDWAISRNRYWGTPLPIWVSDAGDLLCIGSIAELEALSGTKVTDLHKEFVDNIVITKDGKQYRRIPEVLDCWFESGAMPYASFHYPFENKQKFEDSFPAEFISEGQDQTRGWFYTLHVLATALTYGEKPAIRVPETTSSFKNVICSGIVLAEDGKKMSKRLNNYPDPMVIADKYGIDALRLYLVSSPVVRAENLNFSEKGVDEVRRKVVNIILNILSFYTLYREVPSSAGEDNHVMDRWLMSRMESVTKIVTARMEAYDLVSAARTMMEFIDECSTWWLRSSRDRIRNNQGNVMIVFKEVLNRTAILLAPFAPFIADHIYRSLTDNQGSVHLADWIMPDTARIDSKLESDMAEVRKVIEKTHAERKNASIKTRQPLAKLSVTSSLEIPSESLISVLSSEVNVKQVVWTRGDQLEVVLDTVITKELQAEGQARELIRQIQDARKALGTGINDQIEVVAPDWPAAFEQEIKDKVKAVSLTKGENLEIKPCIRD